MLRVLMINGGPLDYGGITSCILNYAAHIDPERIRFDHAVHGYETGSREDEVLAGGSSVYHIPHRRKDPLGNRQALRELFASGKYPIVHSHLDGMNGYALGLAKGCGVPVRIAHCHNTDHLTTDPVRRAIHTMQAKRTPKVATDLIACSVNAAEFFYGSKAADALILRNAIDTERYAFSEAERNRIRIENGIPADAFVIGHVGRFDHQKNHTFLLEVFAGVLETRPDALLMLLGDGMLKEEIQAKARRLGIDHRILFMGYQKDAAGFYSAFDCFVLPSLFEGFGMVLLEAQSAGLQCLASECVPPDACHDGSERLSLTHSDWIEAIASFRSLPVELRESMGADNRRALIRKGFDIGSAAEDLALFYERRMP